MPKIGKQDDVYIGRVIWLKTENAKPPIGSFDQYSLSKKHPYVCTGIELDRDIPESSRRSSWLMTTSDQYRGDSGCVFTSAMKTGDSAWTSKDSYFRRNNCVIIRFSDLCLISIDDISTVHNTIKPENMNSLNLTNNAVFPILERQKMSPTASVFVPSNMKAPMMKAPTS